jgi:hypothetical protein
VSLVLLALAVALLFAGARGQGRPVLRRVGLACLALAVVSYPFVRPALTLPFRGVGQPGEEEAARILEALLNNVYRSFDMRAEEAVYDRLALSVTGDQLTEIYLQSRNSLELEERGGARGRVDEVEILEIGWVRAGRDGGFSADTVWKVSGSVSHFGHTHYRQNRNHAVVDVVADDGVWKIQRVEIVAEERLL